MRRMRAVMLVGGDVMLRLFLVFVMAAHATVGLPSHAAPAQPPADSILVVRGLVVDEAGVPLPRTRVSSPPVLSPGPVFTDADGRFDLRVRDDDAGAIVRISRPGFLAQDWPARALVRELAPIRLVRASAISGRVLDSVSRPVAAIAVRLRRDGAGGGEAIERTTMADDRGEYRFGHLPAGRYVLHTERAVEEQAFLERTVDPQQRANFLRQRAGPPLSDLVDVALSSGEEVTVTVRHEAPNVVLPYASVGGVITGLLLDEHGDPAAGVDVALWQARFTDGRRTLQPAARTPWSRTYQTDDLGRFRIFHVPAGTYYLVATVPAAETGAQLRPITLLPVYYPGRTTVADALPIQVAPAQTVQGVDMVFTPVAGAAVTGVALSATGGALGHESGQAVLIARQQPGSAGPPPVLSALGEDGSFAFAHVPPGEYVVQVTRIAPASGRGFGVPQPAEFGTAPLIVPGPADLSVTVRMAPTAVVSGRIVLEGSAQILPRDIQLAPAPFTPDEAPAAVGPGPVRSPAAAAIADDWTFTMSGLTGLAAFTLARAPAGWWLKSVSIGGRNAADEPVFFAPGDAHRNVTVVLSGAGASIRGRVSDDRGRPAGDYRVIAFSADRQHWFVGSRRVRIAGPQADGTFDLAALPPGDYLVAAVDVVDGDADSGEWQDPLYLNGLNAWARRVAVGEAERRDVELTLLRTGR